MEWLQPAPPGVDSKQEMQVFALVRTGMDKEAIRFLEKTRKISQQEAVMEVAQTKMKLKMF